MRTLLAVLLLLPAVSPQTGATLLRDVNPGSQGSFPRDLVEYRGYVYFRGQDFVTAGTELWRTDGTVAGTRMVADIRPGLGSSDPSEMIVYGGSLYFAANDGVNGAELWATDGTAANTRMVVDLLPGSASGAPAGLTVFQGWLWFGASAAPGTASMWRSDGSAAGTRAAGGTYPTSLMVAGNKLFFVGRMPQGGDFELWVTDGSLTGARLVKDIFPGPYSSQITYPAVLGDRLLFCATEPLLGAELWISDGSEAGTFVLKDINPGAGYSLPTHLVSLGDRVVFAASEPATGFEPWVTDGTTAGTRLLQDIAPGTSNGVYGSQRTLTACGRFALFSAGNATTGYEPWVTDGTPAGTVLLRDLNPGSGHSLPPSNPASPGFTATRVGDNQIWFAANNGVTGHELWRTDGTAAGTRLVADVVPGGVASDPERMTLVGTNVVFVAKTVATGVEPYSVPAGANAVSVGQSCAGGGRNPRLAATDPVLGGTQRIDGKGAPAGASGVLVVGAIAGAPLSAFGCTFWFDLGLHVALPPFPVPQSTWSLPLAIPNDPSLNGAGLALQALLLPTSGPLGFDLTNGVLWRLGT